MDEEIELEKVKFQARAKLEKSAKTSLEDSENSSSVGAKLPRLEISKFQNFFSLDKVLESETEIDKVKLTQVAKFSYLREVLVQCASVDRLLFTTKGYEWAKHIKPSEVENASMQCIIDCPQFTVWIQLKLMNCMRS